MAQDVKEQLPFLVIKDLLVKRGTRTILNYVNVTLNKGETLVVMGISGMGKSTLIKCIIGLLKPQDGEIYINGEEILNLPIRNLNKIRKKLGMVFQSPALFDSLTILENVAFGLREHTKLAEEEIRREVAEKLAIVDLAGTENMFPSQLSGGMQKRASIARAVVTNPELVLYDEPTSGLDPIMSSVINELVNSLKRSLNVTSIVVTHDLTSAYSIGDKIVLLHEGEFVEMGTVETFRNSANPVTRQFIEGSPDGPIKM
ncbi:MAG: ABC transporter ATP-binding protein [Candidatus Eremiobacteraeota bacterium]|nr:ABC transporter ATP-binding protein [Candidatus Eremiobacteraeota bacterium]